MNSFFLSSRAILFFFSPPQPSFLCSDECVNAFCRLVRLPSRAVSMRRTLNKEKQGELSCALFLLPQPGFGSILVRRLLSSNASPTLPSGPARYNHDLGWDFNWVIYPYLLSFGRPLFFFYTSFSPPRMREVCPLMCRHTSSLSFELLGFK